MNVVDSCMAVEGPLAVAPGFFPTACTGFLGIYYLCMDTLLSLDIVGRVLPQSKESMGVGGGNGRKGESGTWDWYVK